MIGRETGKVVEFALHSKSCHVCSTYASKKQSIPAHDCTVTWSGTSKAMEPAMACSMMKSLETSGCPVKDIHGDNDSTTASRLKKDFSSLVKKDDANHVKKSLTSKLYKLSNKYKELKSPTVIPYIARCFTYCVQSHQKRGPEDLKNALDMIVPHLYGNHELCSQNTWCSYSRNPSQYRSFGSSRSLLGRLSASVLQKNEGRSYIGKVNRSSGLSPGIFTSKLADRVTKKRKAAKEKSITTASKRKRMIKKIKKRRNDVVSTFHEGLTYKSNIELEEGSETEQMITEIPNPASVSPHDSFIIFDLETSGLGRNSEILQLAASEKKSKSALNVYMKPRCGIPLQASTINGITFDEDMNKMFHHGKLAESKLVSNGLLDFIEFVQRFQSPILVGHNITNFDIPVLPNKLQEHGLGTEFSTSIKGFIDTLKLSRRIFPKGSVPNYKQETLIKKFTNCNYNAHDANKDVTSLSVLYHARLLPEIQDTDLHNISYHVVKSKYEKMVQSKCISSAVTHELARIGIRPLHLKLALSRDPKGIQLLLQGLHIKCLGNYQAIGKGGIKNTLMLQLTYLVHL